MSMSEYADRDIIAQGEVYTKHVSAMTTEGLHDKSDIAAELAHRDIAIESLEAELEQLRVPLRGYPDLIKRWEDRAFEAEAERDRYREAFIKWGQHLPECELERESYPHENPQCTCGFGKIASQALSNKAES